MNDNIKSVKIGLFLIMLSILFGIALGVGFGASEDFFKSYISEGVSMYPDVHDEKSNSKIWRYVQRAHFHSLAIASLSLGLVILIALSSLKSKLKTISSTLVGLSGLYSFSWFSMFILSPSIGRSAAHDHIVTKLFAYIGTGALLLGFLIIFLNLFLNMFQEE